MDVDIRHLNKTCLDELAYIKLVKKYASKLKYNVLISFDSRIKDYGNYIFDSRKKIHVITISPKICGFVGELKLDDEAARYYFISTTLHEICHARQRETLGKKEFQDLNDDILDGEASIFYSRCEIEARTYENGNLLKAMEFYNSCAKL